MKSRRPVKRSRGDWLAWALIVFGYSLVVFLVGLFGVMVGTFFGAAGQLLGWWLGSLLAVVGQPLWIVQFQSRQKGRAEEPKPGPVERAEVRQSAIVGLVLGSMLGGFVGFYLMVGWVWWAFSPWAAASMREQMEVGFFVIYGSSLTPVFLLLGSIALLGTLGLVLGTLFGVPKDWSIK